MDAARPAELWMQPDPSRARLSRVAIDPAARGRGLGRALVTAMVDAAQRAGFRVVDLRVYDSNIRARRLYESLGFEDSGRDGNEPTGVGLMRLEMDTRPPEPPAAH